MRGTITAVDGHTVAVKNRDGQDLKVVLTDRTAIAAVQALKLSDIKDGTQKIVVPDGTPIVTAVPADRSALKPGEHVFFGAEKAADGTLTPAATVSSPPCNQRA